VELSERHEAILALAARVPEGFVTTYSDLCPEAPRLAGSVLAAAGEGIPWHRIVRSDGSLAQGGRQRRLLDREEVPFDGERVRMDLAHLPREAISAG
jgi:methylated-DNA-protein-cysteine methyltransferase-like protein